MHVVIEGRKGYETYERERAKLAEVIMIRSSIAADKVRSQLEDASEFTFR